MEKYDVNKYFDEVQKITSEIEVEKIQKLADKIKETKKTNSTVFIIGNGGSASSASHWTCDLIKGVIKDYNSQDGRYNIISLADNIATITAYANDLSYDEIFSQQLRNLIKKDDLLIILTGSGRSKNIIKAVEVANEFGAYTFALLGNDGGNVRSMCDECIIIPSRNYGIIEDIHMMIGHLIVILIRGEETLVS